MDMQTKRPSAGWTWLMRGLNAGFEHPKVLFGAGALVLVYVVLVTLVQWVLKTWWVHSVQGQWVITGLMMLLGAVVYPLMMAGFLRLIDAIEHGRPAHALGMLDAFRPGQDARRLITLGLCLTFIYIVFLALVWLTVGQDLGAWFTQVEALSQHPAKGAVLPPLPDGTGTVMAVMMVFLMFYSAVFAIAMGQAALRAQAPLTALRDGVAGAFKNVLPMLVLTLTSVLGLIVFALVLGIAVLIVGAIASLISKALTMVLIVAVYLGVMLLTYVVMFGVMYAIWRDVAGDQPREATGPLVGSVEA